jgi:hypothetical protein
LSAPVSIGDSIRILSKGDKEECWAAIAIEAENVDELREREQVAEQTIAEIANIYAVVTGFSMRFEHDGANGMKSLADLGKPPVMTGIISMEVRYLKERREELQRKLMAGWEQTRLLWNRMQGRLGEKNGQFLRVALSYYYQSGLPPAIPLEEAFVDATIGLEALYNESPQDISYKLASRGALLLSCTGQEKNCFQTLKDLYNLRNNIVHGKGKTVENAQVEKIRELLSKSIRPCLALGLELDKPKIIELIDQAMIEPSARQELIKEIDRRSGELFR